MDESLARFLAVVYAVLIPSAAGLVAYWMHLRSKRQLAREHQTAMAELQQQLDELRDDVTGQVTELQERVDFAERALAQERAARAINPPKPS